MTLEVLDPSPPLSTPEPQSSYVFSIGTTDVIKAETPASEKKRTLPPAGEMAYQAVILGFFAYLAFILKTGYEPSQEKGDLGWWTFWCAVWAYSFYRVEVRPAVTNIRKKIAEHREKPKAEMPLELAESVGYIIQSH